MSKDWETLWETRSNLVNATNDTWADISESIKTATLPDLFLATRIIAYVVSQHQSNPDDLDRCQNQLGHYTIHPLLLRADPLTNAQQLAPIYAALLGIIYENQQNQALAWADTSQNIIDHAINTVCEPAAIYLNTIVSADASRVPPLLPFLIQILQASHNSEEFFSLMQTVVAYIISNHLLLETCHDLPPESRSDLIIACFELAELKPNFKESVYDELCSMYISYTTSYIEDADYQDDPTESFIAHVLDAMNSFGDDIAREKVKRAAEAKQKDDSSSTPTMDPLVQLSASLLKKCRHLIGDMSPIRTRTNPNAGRVVPESLLQLQKETVRFLGVLAQSHQADIRTSGALDLIFPLTAMSDLDPTLRHWALLAFGVALKDCPENQKYVQERVRLDQEAAEPVDIDELKKSTSQPVPSHQQPPSNVSTTANLDEHPVSDSNTQNTSP